MTSTSVETNMSSMKCWWSKNHRQKAFQIGADFRQWNNKN
jgi:hypothetical protein